jgi:hypothetical protein
VQSSEVELQFDGKDAGRLTGESMDMPFNRSK